MKMPPSRTIIEYTVSTIKIASTLSAGIGAIIVASYCLMIEFYPVGISLSDTIFLIFIMLGLLLTLTIGTLIGCLSTLFILPITAKIKSTFTESTNESPFGEDKHYEKVDTFTILLSLSFFILVIISIILITSNDQNLHDKTSNIKLIIGFLFGGFFLGCGIYIQPKLTDGSILPVRKSRSNMIMICAAFIIPMIIGSPGKIIESPFSYFGISDRNGAVSIDTESWKKIKYAAQLSKIDPDACENGKDLIVLKNTEILWSKIGDRALLRIFGKDKRHDTPFIEIEVPSKIIFPIKVDNAQIECNS